MLRKKYTWIIRHIVSILLVASCNLSVSAKPAKKSGHKSPKLPIAIDHAKNIMDDVYTGVSGFSLDSKESEVITQNGGNDTYGEILFDSLQTLLNDVKLTKKDTFYDLGCGVGKACMQVALTTPAKAIGIELAKSRISKAVNAKKLIHEKYKINLNKQLVILEENLLKTKFKPRSIVYFASTCYSEKFLDQVATLAKNTPGKIRIFSLKQLPQCTALKTYNLAMSWSSNVNVYYYELGKKLN